MKSPAHFTGIIVAFLVLVGGTLVRKHKLYLGKKDFITAPENVPRYRKKFFRDVTDRAGIDHQNTRALVDAVLYNRLDTIFVAPGVAVADFNGDGHFDAFLPATAPHIPNRLYLNRGDGSFSDVTDEWKIYRNTTGKLAAINATAADLNSDGKTDLLLTGFGCTHVWINEGRSFQDRTLDSVLGDCENSLAAIPYDFNGDGHLDIYLLRYWGPQDMFHLKDPHIYVNNLYNATNGGSNEVFINDGQGRFRKETKERNAGDRYWSYDAIIADFDLNGTPDVYVSNDYGPDQLYEIRDGKFVNRSNTFARPDRRYGMNASLGDLDGDEKPHIYVSNAHEGPPYGLTGNFLWKLRNGRPVEESRDRNVMNCGFAWGAAFVDWDVDGYVDLYVANGFISSRMPASNEIPRIVDPNSNLFNVLQIRTLPGEFSSDIRNWISFTKERYLHGAQRDCLFMNQENRYMVNIAEIQGMDPLGGDNRAVGVIDLENDGDLDIILTSRNVRTTVWENLTNPPARKWVGLSLNRGTGARVTLEQDKKIQTRWHTGGRNGFLASSDPRVHFGLRSDSPFRIKVHWPGGKVDEWNNLSPGKYHDLERKPRMD